MAVLDKEKDFFWSGEALDRWGDLKKKLNSIITDEARAIAEKKSSNTISDDDMKAIIKKSLKKITQDG